MGHIEEGEIGERLGASCIVLNLEKKYMLSACLCEGKQCPVPMHWALACSPGIQWRQTPGPDKVFSLRGKKSQDTKHES